MCNQLLNRAWAIELCPSSKLVLVCLADMASPRNHDMCWPSISRITRRTGLTDRTVQVHLNNLEKGEHITRIPRSGKSTKYAVHPREKCTPEEVSEVNADTSTPADIDTNPRSSCTQTITTQNSKPSERVNRKAWAHLNRMDTEFKSFGNISEKQVAKISDRLMNQHQQKLSGYHPK